MSADSSQIGNRAWNYAGVLQQAGLSCVDYVGQLALDLFSRIVKKLPQWTFCLRLFDRGGTKFQETTPACL